MGIFMKRLSFCRFFHFTFKLKPSTMGFAGRFFLPSSFSFEQPKPYRFINKVFQVQFLIEVFFSFVWLRKKGHFWIVLIANIEFVYKIGTFHSLELAHFIYLMQINFSTIIVFNMKNLTHKKFTHLTYFRMYLNSIR